MFGCLSRKNSGDPGLFVRSLSEHRGRERVAVWSGGPRALMTGSETKRDWEMDKTECESANASRASQGRGPPTDHRGHRFERCDGRNRRVRLVAGPSSRKNEGKQRKNGGTN